MSAKIGLEVHLYVAARSKLHCGCDADFLAAARPNANLCPICVGQPGAKPLPPNEAAYVAALRLARALGMVPSPRARVLRKHYFYPDSPANYQRTGEPVATGGSLTDVALTELHVEEDPGAYDADAGTVDLNRAGAPLIELVTEPTIRDPAHARLLMQELRLDLAYLGIHREAAGMKADCNASLEGGARVEVKNVHGARNVERALEAELARQRSLISNGGVVKRETRGFDEASGTTATLREKETDADYRHLPDPDVAPLDLARLAARIPPEESPFARRARIATRAGVREEEAGLLIEERALADAYDLCATPASFAFLARDVRAELEYRRTKLAHAPVTPADLAALADARHAGHLQPQAATRLLRAGFDTGNLATLLAAELGQAAPAEDALAAAVRDALAQNPKAIADWRAGKTTALNYLVGQAMRRLQGRADAHALRQAVETALGKQS
ncbi:MAG: aspartyl-tRNA(Asn)/glutamyl-tRNA(Gln) amidotransferase subunit [Thermoplasmata archaeon]|jgi:aspartyl-tRNA(Asn)/glutamyl-tRNA(Gln) amidotransferase subunit B|nr:aspartyl-tRNA(Asn)/glutamyl-tRNA(Gln) amidotransferase subunit [Thermoplasmata archaeon]